MVSGGPICAHSLGGGEKIFARRLEEIFAWIIHPDDVGMSVQTDVDTDKRNHKGNDMEQNTENLKQNDKDNCNRNKMEQQDGEQYEDDKYDDNDGYSIFCSGQRCEERASERPRNVSHSQIEHETIEQN